MRVVMLVQKVDAADWLLGFTVSWIRALAARVERLDVITLEQGAADLPANVCVHSLGKERGASRPQQLLTFERAISRLARRADVIFGHLTPRYTWLAAPAAVLNRVPQCMWYTHRHVGPELRMALACVRWVTTAAPGSFPLPSRKVHVMGHGIDAERFTPGDALSINDPPLVLAVGRLAPIKHHHILLEAAARLHEQGIAARFAVAGGIASADGPNYQASLQARIAELNIQDRFSLLGVVQGEALLDLYRQASVVTNLSPPGLFDKAALEAMLTARPVLVANSAFDDLLNGYTELLRVPAPDQIDAVADHLKSLLQLSVAERATIGAGLRERTLQAHSLDRLMERLIALFASA